MAVTKIKDERINVRLKSDKKSLIERAASLEGKTVSNFIVASAVDHAEKTVHEYEIMRLNRKESEAFFNALSSPVLFNKKLSTALKSHDKRVASK